MNLFSVSIYLFIFAILTNILLRLQGEGANQTCFKITILDADNVENMFFLNVATKGDDGEGSLTIITPTFFW